jgi:hypothetical protein
MLSLNYVYVNALDENGVIDTSVCFIFDLWRRDLIFRSADRRYSEVWRELPITNSFHNISDGEVVMGV